MFVLGIDPGLSRCGYGAVREERGQLQEVASGVLTTSTDDALESRLATLLGALRDLLGRLRPDAVVVERVLFQVNARTAMSVGQVSGLALAVAAESGYPVVQYSPNEVKQAVGGYGSAGKEQVQRMVQVLLGLPDLPRPADRADALALAVCYLSGAGFRRATAAAAAGDAGPGVAGASRSGAILASGAGRGSGAGRASGSGAGARR